MKAIIKSFCRNTKVNIINIFLITTLILFIYIFVGVEDYFKYNINEVYGGMQENRGYILKVDDNNFVSELQDVVNVETVNCENLDMCYVVIKNFKDTDKFGNYLESKNIYFYLADTTKSNELTMYEKTLDIYVIFKVIGMTVTFIILFLCLKSICNYEKTNFALLKALGYNNIKMIKILTLKLLIILFSSIILSILIITFFKYYMIYINSNFSKFLNSFEIIKYFKWNFLNIIIVITNIVIYITNINKIDVLTILND